MSQPGPADIAAVAQRLQSGSAAEQARAGRTLFIKVASSASYDELNAITGAIAAAGGLPALLQLIGSRSGHPGAADAAAVLSDSAFKRRARCQAILEAGGIAPLVRSLQSSSPPALQANAAAALNNLSATSGGGEAGAAAVVAAGAMLEAIRHLSSSDDVVSQRMAGLLGNIGSTPERQHAIVAAEGVSLLVSLLRRTNAAVVARAATALGNFAAFEGCAPCVAAIEAAGGIRALVELLATGSGEALEAAAIAVNNKLRFSPASTAAPITEAGGLQALARCLEGQRFTEATHICAAKCIAFLASGGAGAAIADAGGARALVQALARPCSAEARAAIAAALRNLLLNGQAAPVAAIDRTDSATAALAWLPLSPRIRGNPEAPKDVSEALRLLAAARICSAPGCGATSRLRRCAGCGSVRYCGDACMRAHWKEHRTECKRLRAAAAAAAGGAGPSGRP